MSGIFGNNSSDCGAATPGAGAGSAPGITIYTTKLCPYCVAAKRLLKQKQVDFAEIDVTFNPGRRREMMQEANGRSSVPQIFIGDRHIGGCDELYALENQGDLDALLRKA